MAGLTRHTDINKLEKSRIYRGTQSRCSALTVSFMFGHYQIVAARTSEENDFVNYNVLYSLYILRIEHARLPF